MSEQTEPTVEEILSSIKQVIARENRSMAAGSRAPRQEAPVDDVLELSAEIEADASELEDEDDDAALVSGATRSSMRESLAALSMLAEPGAAPPRMVRSGETSVEDLLRELLKPALAEWLDANLPALVEKMVADEIRRISGREG